MDNTQSHWNRTRTVHRNYFGNEAGLAHHAMKYRLDYALVVASRPDTKKGRIDCVVVVRVNFSCVPRPINLCNLLRIRLSIPVRLFIIIII